jgi:hypothetical protein
VEASARYWRCPATRAADDGAAIDPTELEQVMSTIANVHASARVVAATIVAVVLTAGRAELVIHPVVAGA